MTNRRQFLQIGLASSSLPLAAAAAKANALESFLAESGGKSIPFYKVIADDRYPESMAFAEEMDRRGFDVHVLEGGDLTSFWAEDLSAIWKTLPVAVAGVTNFRPLFCLEQLGRSFGTRVIYRGEHFYDESGSVSHRLEGPTGMMARCEQGLDFKTTTNAARSLADIISGCESGATEIVRNEITERTGKRTPLSYLSPKQMRTSYSGTSHLTIDMPHEQALTSWIVAPAHQT